MLVPDRTKATMQPIVGANVEPGIQIYSDEHGEAWRMEQYQHDMVNHLHAYVDDNVRTNGMENFCSLLKRTIGGTDVSVDRSTCFGTSVNRHSRLTTVCRWPMQTGSAILSARSLASALPMPN